MDSISPSISECLYLLRLTGNVFYVSVFHISCRGGPLEVRIELNAIGRIKIDALHLATESLSLSQRSHHLQTVAKNHAVGPMGIMLIELCLCGFAGKSIEISKEVDLRFRGLGVYFGAAL